ncbi:unnamed protein product [Auanema sp. JU1783]|nr:unnamed protein product [Auanema sp. JU1783]
MNIIFLFLSILQLSTAFFNEQCPLGWISSGEWCVKMSIQPETYHKAQKFCESEGGQLFHSEIQTEVDDVIDILDDLYKRGVHESTWIISLIYHTPRAISRHSDGNYSIITTSTSATYPFICSLTQSGRRMLNFQQMLLPKGAPKIVSSSLSEIYFHPRNGADFVPIPCSVEAQPPTTITWYKNDIQIIHSSSSSRSSNESYLLSGGTLLVPALSSLAYSSFHCVASNEFGKIRSASVLLKPAFLDSFAERRHDVLPLVGGGARLECDAPAHQPKSFSFTWLIGTTNRVLHQSPRVFISSDGSLYFSSVTPDDDEKYACALSLSSTQSGHYGPFFRLRVGGAQPQSPPRIPSHLPQVFPETPTVEDTVYIECFAYGNPVPTYKWTRVDGHSLGPRATITNFGRILRIDNVQMADSGRYRCTAGNSLNAAHSDVVLTLKSRPTVVLPLYDRLVSTESTFHMDCPLSNADRHSTIEWFKDANPIVPLLMKPDERSRYKVDDSRLTVSDTRLSDSGIYECIISNEIGVSISSAHVFVKDAAPAFPLQAMPLKVYAIKGSTLNMPCIYQASPHGHSKWTDAGGNKLPHKGRVREEKGILIIQDILPDDEGLFFCSAHNRLGRAHSQVHLIVVDKPRIRVKTNKGSTSEFSNLTCEVELECQHECPETLISWSLNDKPIGHKNKKHMKTKIHEHRKHSGYTGYTLNQKMDLEIPHSEKHLGRYACSSVIGGASIEFPSKLSPPPPVSVTVSTKNNSIHLSWKKPPSHREPRDYQDDGVKGYLVEIRTRSDRQWRSIPRDLITKSEAEGFFLESLTPNNDYQFRVRSLDASSLGEPSTPTEWIHTPSAAPQDPIEDLNWKIIDPGTILVEWKPIEQDHKSGENLRYRVTWSESSIDDQSSEKPHVLTHHLESKQPQAIVRLNSTEGCRAVALAIRPFNDEGPSPVSTDTVALISSTGKLRAADITSAVPLNGTHIHLKWEWVGENECQVAHAIKISCKAEKRETVTAMVSSQLYEWTLAALEPETLYSCSVMPYNNKGSHGEPSHPHKIWTKQYPPQEAPSITKLSLKPLSDDSGYTTILEWSAVDLRNDNSSDVSAGYKIYIYISETASEAVVLSMPNSRLTSSEKPSARLDGLRLMYMYTIQVAAYNDGGIGPLSPPKTIRLGTASTIDSSSSPSVFLSVLLVSLYVLLF